MTKGLSLNEVSELNSKCNRTTATTAGEWIDKLAWKFLSKDVENDSEAMDLLK